MIFIVDNTYMKLILTYFTPFCYIRLDNHFKCNLLEKNKYFSLKHKYTQILT